MPDAHLLVIDDDSALANAICDCAAAQGFASVVCRNAHELEQAYRNDLTAIVIDMQGGDTDGVEIIRRLAELGCRAGLILITGLDRSILRAAEQLVVDQDLLLVGSVKKPFHPAHLQALLTKARSAAAARKLRRTCSASEGYALDPDDLVVLFQPKIDIRTLDFTSVEALVRWRHPRLGLLGPAHFVPSAEANGSIQQITDAVLHKALAQCAAWVKEELVLRVAVNVSTRLLCDLTLPDRFADAAALYKIEPEHIVLEITETWLNEDPVRALDSLTRLRIKGFELSIDDFGTGYSSIQQLSRIPFSELKIDGSFVQLAPTNAQARHILSTSVELGHNMDLNVVAEGVETQDQWDLVCDLACDECQGFFIARPLKGNTAPAWLKRWNAMHGRGASRLRVQSL